MLRNYLKVAWRNIRRQKLYSFINILGLTVGLTSFLLIFLYVNDELSYDDFHPDAEEVYRMSYFRKAQSGDIEPFATSGTTWAPRYVELYPEVTDYAILTHAGYPGYINRENKNDVYIEPDFKWSTDNFFQFFNFELLQGNPESALTTLNAVVLTESTAKKYFGDENPMGQNIHYNVSGVEAILTVTGVMKDPPANTHIKPTFVGNVEQIHRLYMSQYQYDFLNQAGDAFAFTYLKVSDDRVLEKIESDWKEYMNTAFANSQNNQAEAYDAVKFTALTDLHFEPEMKWELESPANPAYIPIFIITALMVLLIACINFMNLATARSAKRAKEIGLRKTLGGTKKQLITQFYGESFLMTCIALLLSLGVLLLVIKPFNILTDKSFVIADVLSPTFLLMLLMMGLVVGLTSGSYPALYLSNFKPISALRGLFVSGRGAENIRKGLVVFQFTVSIILIISTLVVYNQLKLINGSSLGKDKDRILSVRLGGFGLGERDQIFKDQIEQDSRFESVTIANHLPRLPHFGLINQNFRFPDRDNEELEWNRFNVEFNFANTFDLKLVAGRDFDHDMRSDSNAILLNTSAVAALSSTPEEVIGTTITDRVFNQQQQQQVDITGRVIGVVEDFPYKSVTNRIEPLVMWGTPDQVDRIMYIKMTPGAYDAKLDFLKEKWKELVPGMPMESWFMDYEFGRLYENERKMSRIFLLFSGITILIAIMGLFALTSYVTEQRKKEIGVRKVLGASESSLVMLLVTHFLKLVAVAFVIALPIAYLFMSNWLGTFVYRVNVSIGIIGIAGVFVLVITLATVGIDTYKTAIANPGKTLRAE